MIIVRLTSPAIEAITSTFQVDISKKVSCAGWYWGGGKCPWRESIYIKLYIKHTEKFPSHQLNSSNQFYKEKQLTHLFDIAIYIKHTKQFPMHQFNLSNQFEKENQLSWFQSYI